MKRSSSAVFSQRIVVLVGLLCLVLAASANSAVSVGATPELHFAMGMPPNPEICRYNVVLLERSNLMPEEGVFSPDALEIAQACNAKVIVRLHGKTEDITASGGGLDLAKFENQINDFAGLIDPFVANGTIISHLTIDEPHDCSDWSMLCPLQSEVDAAASISEEYWPDLDTTVNTLPAYAAGYQWVNTDLITFVYAYHKGDLQTFVQDAVDVYDDGSINSIGWGIQAYAGGCPIFDACSMSPAQVVEVGTAVCDTQIGDFVWFTRHKTDLLTPEMKQAIEDVRGLCGDPASGSDWPFEVQGRVFGDLDNDGVFEPPEEQPLAGASVKLVYALDGSVHTRTTGPDGIYNYNDMAPYTATLSVEAGSLPVGHTSQYSRQLLIGTQLSEQVDLSISVNGVGGIIFRDNNLNQLYDPPADTAYAGVVTRLHDSLGMLVGTTASNAQGGYSFRGLANDTYTVTVDPASISPNWTAFPYALSATLTETTYFGSKSFAVQPPSNTVTGKVYADLNFNQIFDPPYEPALSGVKVRLTKTADGVQYTLNTDSQGNYQYYPLASGAYSVTVDGATLPVGHINVFSPQFVLTALETRVVDFAVRVNGISGLAYRDEDEDLTFTPGIDTPYSGVTMIADGDSRPPITTVSDSAGYYEFRGLPSDTYTISVDENSIAGDEFSYYLSKIRAVSTDTFHQGTDFPIHTVELGGLFISAQANGTVGGVSFRDEDILSYDEGTGAWEMYIDLSDVGVSANLDAFHIDPDGSILMSFDKPVTLAGLGTVDDSDIVRFTPTAVGSNTAGTFAMYFDGSAYQLTTSGEDIDAFGFAPDGRLVVSVLSTGNVGFGSIQDEDLIVFDSQTSSWSWYFDGSDVGLDSSSSENISGVRIAPNGDIYLTTTGNFAVTGVSGTRSDIFVCTSPVIGSNTSCTFSMYWVGSAHGFGSFPVDGIDLN